MLTRKDKCSVHRLIWQWWWTRSVTDWLQWPGTPTPGLHYVTIQMMLTCYAKKCENDHIFKTTSSNTTNKNATRNSPHCMSLTQAIQQNQRYCSCTCVILAYFKREFIWIPSRLTTALWRLAQTYNGLSSSKKHFPVWVSYCFGILVIPLCKFQLPLKPREVCVVPNVFDHVWPDLGPVSLSMNICLPYLHEPKPSWRPDFNTCPELFSTHTQLFNSVWYI